MSPLLLIIFLVIGSSFSGCADTSSYTSQPPHVTQGERYIETEGLSQLPNRRLAITSFGIEYETKLLFPVARDHYHSFGGEIHTDLQDYKEVTLDLANDQMQSLADQVYTQLVMDLQAAGYNIVPDNRYQDLPAYRSLIELAGNESPVSITFTRGDPEHVVQGEAMVFAPRGLRWYPPALAEGGSRLGKTRASLGSELRFVGRGLLGRNAVSQAEVDLANALNASLVKVYVVVSPVQNVGDTTFQEGALPVKGSTILGRGETRLAFRTPDAPTSPHPRGMNTPPRDGNAFVRLQRDIRVNNDLASSQALETHLDVIGKLFILAMMAER